MKIIFRSLIFFFLIQFSFISCDYDSNAKQIKEKNKIVLSDSLTEYNPFMVETSFKKSKYKLFVYLNVSCSSCLDEMNEWSVMAKKLYELNCICKFILYSKDNFQYFKYLYEEGEIKKNLFPFYLDTNDYFLMKNPIVKKYAIGECYLTDENNEVLLYGDFIHSKELKSKLFKTITK